MKKAFIIVLAALLICVSSVCAQEEAVELSILNLGDLFSWGDQAEDVYNLLTSFDDVQVGADTDDAGHNYIIASVKLEDETDIYVFYFTDNDYKLWELEAFATFSDEYDPDEVLAFLIDTYNLDDLDDYEGDAQLESYAADFDYARIVADDATIAVYGGSAATEDKDARVFITMFDREYWES